MTNVVPFLPRPKPPRKAAPLTLPRISDDPYWLADALGMRDQDGKPREPSPK